MLNKLIKNYISKKRLDYDLSGTLDWLLRCTFSGHACVFSQPFSWDPVVSGWTLHAKLMPSHQTLDSKKDPYTAEIPISYSWDLEAMNHLSVRPLGRLWRPGCVCLFWDSVALLLVAEAGDLKSNPTASSFSIWTEALSTSSRDRKQAYPSSFPLHCSFQMNT